MIIRVMAILQGASGEPKDRYVNNFHFADVADDEIVQDHLDNIGGALDAFYAVVDPFIPDTITRLPYRFYNLDDPEPREPTYVDAVAQPSSENTPFPYEVAATLSYYSARNIPRQRGRIFLGPLTSNVATTGSVNSDPHISSTFRDAVVAAAVELQDDVTVSGGAEGAALWSILSPTDATTRPITHVWMDNAFDTIRARGSEATTRTTLEI